MLAIILATLALAAIPWSARYRLTNNTSIDLLDLCSGRHIVGDSLGRLHVIWTSQPRNYLISYKRYTPGTGWSKDTTISSDASNTYPHSRYPSICLDSTGTLHVVWASGWNTSAYEAIYYKSCTPTGTGVSGWAPRAKRLSDNYSARTKTSPCIAASSRGVGVAWAANFRGGYICWRESSVAWTGETRLDSTDRPKLHLSLCSPADSQFALVYPSTSADNLGRPRLFALWRTGSSWHDTVRVANGFDQANPSAAADRATGQVWALWRARPSNTTMWRIAATSLDSTGYVADAETVAWTGLAATQQPGSLDVTPSGTVWASWPGRGPLSTTVDRLMFSYRPPGDTWRAPVYIYTSSHAWSPSTCSDWTNSMHVIWCDAGDVATRELYYSTRPGPVDLDAVAIVFPQLEVDSGVTSLCSVRVRSNAPVHVARPPRFDVLTCWLKFADNLGYSIPSVRTIGEGGDSTWGVSPKWIPCGRGYVSAIESLYCPADTFPNNDTVHKQVFIRVHDLSTESVDYPPQYIGVGTYDPRATFRNRGNVREPCEVHFHIDSPTPYDAELVIPQGLPIGADTSITFPTWSIFTLGTYTGTVHTVLPSDLTPGNNELTQPIEVGA